MSTIFSKIIAGEIPCHRVAENENYLAFLDISPVVEGHTLVIPKREVSYLFDLDDQLYAGLWLFAKGLVPSIAKAIPCLRVGVSVIGLEVPHTHIHLVPLNRMEDINFSKPKLTLSSTQLAETANRIRQYLL